MNRRRLLGLVAGGTVVSLAGCTEEDEQPEPEDADENIDNDDPTDDNDPEPVEDDDGPQTLSITNVDAPGTGEQGENIEIEVSVNTEAEYSVAVGLFDNLDDDEPREEDSVTVEDPDETTVLLEISMHRHASTGEKNLLITAESDGVEVTETQSFEVLEGPEAWELHLDRAIGHLEDMLDDVASNADGDEPTLIDVTMTDSGVELGDYRFDQISDAEDKIWDAKSAVDSNTPGRETIDIVEKELDQLKILVGIQEELQTFYGELEDALELVIEERQTTPGLRDSYIEIENEFDEMVDIDVEEYSVEHDIETKIDQFETEIEILDLHIAAISDLYTSFGPEGALDARRGFDDVLDLVDNPDTYPPTDSTDEDLVDHVEGWWEETDEIATGE